MNIYEMARIEFQCYLEDRGWPRDEAKEYAEEEANAQEQDDLAEMVEKLKKRFGR